MIQGFGRYNLLCKIGEGGMGTVYLARQKMLKRYCAIKVIHPHHGVQPALAERFLREARAAAALNHPHLVNVFDCDQHESQYFLAMDYVEGLSLGDVLRAHGAVPLPLALHWLEQSAVALEFAHSKGVIHRDIKPDNILIDAEGKIRVTDLGLAKTLFEGDTQMTMTGFMMGTPHYMSPEQVTDSKTADPRSDVYSLGVTFYHMLAGRAPFERSSWAAICVAHLHEAMPSISLPDTELTSALDSLIACMTAKERDQRFQSMSDLLGALAPWRTQYPLDDASAEFCARLDVSEQRIVHKLDTVGINRTEIDSDIRPVKTTLMSEPTIAMAPPPRRRVSPLVAGIAVVLIGVIGGGVIIFSRSRPSEVTTTPALITPAAVVEPGVPSLSPPAPAPPVVKTGSLLVSTEPKNAFVLFRGRSKTAQGGAVSFEDVEPGAYPLEVRLPGYQNKLVQVEIVPDQVAQPHVVLERITGSAHLVSDPAGADVLVNGTIVGKTPYTLRGGEGEEVRCELRLTGFDVATLNISLRPTEPTNTVTLARAHVSATNIRKPLIARAGIDERDQDDAIDSPRSRGTRVDPDDDRDPTRRALFDHTLLRRKVSDILTRSHAQASQWQSTGRKRAQTELETFFSNSGMPRQHMLPVIKNFMPIMDRAMKLSATEFAKRRMEITHELMEVFRTNAPPAPDEDSDFGDGPPEF